MAPHDNIEVEPDDMEATLDDMGVTPDDIELATLFIEYENLRRERCRAYERIQEMDVRLLELERELLPDSYTFPGDLPLV